ncbi:MAG: toll/interleukin-1 receptor domain-containing protein [Phycisphaerales bacterium JB058]
MPDPEPHHPRVFISYTHENPSHKAWVHDLATSLVENGVDVLLDQWENSLGSDLARYMEAGIRNSNRTILVCTPTYKLKADEGAGGVGYERLVVTGELAQNTDTTKFIPVLRIGNKSNAFPSFLGERLYVDFTNNDIFAESLDSLLRDIHGAPRLSKPPLGKNPYQQETTAPTAPAQPIRPTSHSHVQADSAEEAISVANQIIKSNDKLEWKQFVRSLNRDWPDTQAKWKNLVWENSDGFSTTTLQQMIELAGNKIATSLVAADSENPYYTNQTAVLSDIVNPLDWPRSGLTTLVYAPTAAGFAFHHFLGALYSRNNQYSELASLITAPLYISKYESYRSLIEDRQLVGFCESLGCDCLASYDFLISCYDLHPWLQSFFSSKEDYLLAIQAYRFSLSIAELASRIVSARSNETSVDLSPRLKVPPLHFYRSSKQRNPAVQRAVTTLLPNLAAIRNCCDAFGMTEAELRTNWGKWMTKASEWNKGHFDDPPWSTLPSITHG